MDLTKFYELERERMLHEKKISKNEVDINEFAISPEDIYNRGTPYESLSPYEKYICYRLRKIRPKEDEKLYNRMTFMFKQRWIPNDIQEKIEENLIATIEREYGIFFGEKYDKNGIFSVGDIIVYFAEKFSFELYISFAGSCEIMLRNMDAYMDFDDSKLLYSHLKTVANSFLKSDFESGCNSIFGTDFEAKKVPNWTTQFNAFLMRKL